jgi:hypothetical protein
MRCLFAILFAVMLGPTLTRDAVAQSAVVYKVGDKIECQITRKWQPGTIVEVQRGGSGELPIWSTPMVKRTRGTGGRRPSVFRARTGLPSNTTQAHNELIALGALKPPAADSLDETFQKLIRERHELQGSQEFPVTVTFQGFLIGRTHAYGRPDFNGESADGPGGQGQTIVTISSRSPSARANGSCPGLNWT